jgi:uncharacterized protein (TIRG00374 family)
MLAGRPAENVQQHLVWWVLASIALAVAACSLLFRLTGMDEVRSILAALDLRHLVAVVVLEIASLACLAQLYRSTFRSSGGTIGFTDGLTVSLGAFSLAQLLPGGGAVGGLYAARRLARRHGADPVTAGMTVIVVGVVAMGTLGVLVSAGATTAALFSPDYTPYAVAAAVVTAGFFVLALLTRRIVDLPWAREGLATALRRLARDDVASEERWSRLLQRQFDRLRHPVALLWPAGWSALNWSLDLAVLALLAVAAGTGAPVLAVVVAYGVANLLNGLPLTPGGIGIVETGITGALVLFGAEPAAAAVAAIGYRVVAHWLPVAIAAPLFASGLRRSRPQEAAS